MLEENTAVLETICNEGAPSESISSDFFLVYFYLFIWLLKVLVVACGV